MTVLKSLESKIAGVVEGTFSRVFRSEVRPVEIARKLAREMEEHKYARCRARTCPNEYRVYLSPRDRERFQTMRTRSPTSWPAICSSMPAASGSRCCLGR